MTAPRIAIIGGGITGLSAALKLQELLPEATLRLFEGKSRVGGVLGTQRVGDYLLEQSADMFTTREPWAIDLCRRIGFDKELIGTNDKHRRAFVVRDGRLHPVPEGFTLLSTARIGPLLRSPLLSIRAKARMGWEYFVPPRMEDADESLEHFVIRRFGREAFERLVQPLIGGIYTADPAKLSMQATLPQFLQMEREHGSLLRGMRKQRPARAPTAKMEVAESGARYGMFVAPREGMESFVQAIAAKLRPEVIQKDSPVEGVKKEAGGPWILSIKRPSGCVEQESFDALIVAAPAYACRPLLEPIDSEFATLVGSIEHAGCSVVISCYRRDQLSHPLDGFGIVLPHVEGRRIIATSFSSVKFSGRAPADRIILRTFVGGALQPQLNSFDDAALQQLVAEELAALVGAKGPPEISRVVRWQGVMPQYHVGHVQLVDRIEARAATIPNFALAGNAYRGVGIPFCVRSGERAAEHIANNLSPRPAP
jgi:oxygen-dependent protoporphyrinogen oxidase